jgi:translocation and assembly module TamA
MPTLHQVFVSAEKFSACIVLDLETGPRYFFGEVSSEDNEVHPERLLRWYAAFKPGDIYSL